MRASTIQEIKQELLTLKAGDLANLCLRLGRFKKENKELLTYLLFEAQDEESYIRSVKTEVEELFGTINLSHLYFAKKTLRRILRVINKYSRYSGNKQTDIELRIFFCRQLHDSGIPFHRNTVISNLYDGQLKKIYSTLATLHEDLQHDYRKELETLTSNEGPAKKNISPGLPKKS
ncbi:MAG TPA: hypothetical protein VGO58_00335 [Chitinophagaceae bacterium]|jgi:hypothetical protein|nr:hypothetical protein [Chitinophagaceae bacterium]